MEIPNVDEIGEYRVESCPVQKWVRGIQRFNYRDEEMLRVAVRNGRSRIGYVLTEYIKSNPFT
jgi:hypothetical protein